MTRGTAAIARAWPCVFGAIRGFVVKIGKNNGRIIDTVPDLVPEWRLQAVKGNEKKIDCWYSQYEYTGPVDVTGYGSIGGPD